MMRDKSIFTGQFETDYEKRELEAIRRLKLQGKLDEAHELYEQLKDKMKSIIWEKR